MASHCIKCYRFFFNSGITTIETNDIEMFRNVLLNEVYQQLFKTSKKKMVQASNKLG